MDRNSARQTTRTRIKFYSWVGSNRSALDAIREIRRKHPFGAEDEAKIVMHGSRVTSTM